MSITKSGFGYVNENAAYLYTLKNKNGMSVSITDFGANIVSIVVPDKCGNFGDVVLGYDNANGYFTGTASIGAMVGRYANRIKEGKFVLNGIEYNLALNDNGINHLHGGNVGYNKRFWEVENQIDGENPTIEFSYTDPDGEENYPGTLKVKIKFTVTNDNTLKIEYFAISDKDTIVNLTNHSYFNLTGNPENKIYQTELKINSDKYTPTDKELIPTGEIKNVKGIALDFTSFRDFGSGLNNKYPEMENANGYDHNFILGEPHIMRLAAEAFEPTSGRIMEVLTDMPAIQLYTGNFLDSSEIGKGNIPLAKHTGFCLETQFTPNSPNLKDFPSCVLKIGEEYKYTTIYSFKVK